LPLERQGERARAGVGRVRPLADGLPRDAVIRLRQVHANAGVLQIVSEREGVARERTPEGIERSNLGWTPEAVASDGPSAMITKMPRRRLMTRSFIPLVQE